MKKHFCKSIIAFVICFMMFCPIYAHAASINADDESWSLTFEEAFYSTDWDTDSCDLFISYKLLILTNKFSDLNSIESIRFGTDDYANEPLNISITGDTVVMDGLATVKVGDANTDVSSIDTLDVSFYVFYNDETVLNINTTMDVSSSGSDVDLDIMNQDIVTDNTKSTSTESVYDTPVNNTVDHNTENKTSFSFYLMIIFAILVLVALIVFIFKAIAYQKRRIEQEEYEERMERIRLRQETKRKNRLK